MILGIQVIAIIFILIMFYFSYLHYRRGEINGLEALLLMSAWIGAILITLFPKIFSVFAGTIAISRAFDLAVIGGFILVISLVYLAYIKVRRLEKKLESYVMSEALHDFDKKGKEKN